MIPLLTLLALGAAPPLTPISPRLITMSVDSRVSFPATQLTATVQVVGKDKDVAGARKSADEKLRKLVEALRVAGVEARRLQAFDNGVSPDSRGSEVIGQLATRSVLVSIVDLTQADAVFTAANRAGAMVSGPVTFSADTTSFEAKARLEAATIARARASAMVEALGGKLGLPRTVSDHLNGSQVTTTRYLQPSADGSVTTNATSVDLTVVVHLTAQFDIRDE